MSDSERNVSFYYWHPRQNVASFFFSSCRMSDVFWNNISCHEEGIAFHFLWEDCDISCTRGEAFCSMGSSASQWKNKLLWKENETWIIIVNKSQFYVKSKNFFLIPVCAVTIRWSRAQKVFQCTHLISLSCVYHNHNDWPEEEKQNIPLLMTTWNLSSFSVGDVSFLNQKIGVVSSWNMLH